MTEQRLQEIEALCVEITCLRCDKPGEGCPHCGGSHLVTSHPLLRETTSEVRRLRDEARMVLLERDALMVRVDQLRRMADREVTAHVEMRADRDAAVARAEQAERERDAAHRQVISLSQDNAALQIERDAARAEVAVLQTSNGRLSFALAEAQLAASSSWRCFKCGMVLTDESAARNHFGDEECYAQLRDTSNSLRNKLLAADREVQRLVDDVRRLRAELQAVTKPTMVTLDRWSDAVVTALEADRSKASATIATLRAELQAAQGEAYPRHDGRSAKPAHPTPAQEGR